MFHTLDPTSRSLEHALGIQVPSQKVIGDTLMGLGFNLGCIFFVLFWDFFVFRVSWQVQYFVDLEMLLCGP